MSARSAEAGPSDKPPHLLAELQSRRLGTRGRTPEDHALAAYERAPKMWRGLATAISSVAPRSGVQTGSGNPPNAHQNEHTGVAAPQRQPSGEAEERHHDDDVKDPRGSIETADVHAIGHREGSLCARASRFERQNQRMLCRPKKPKQEGISTQ